MSNPSHNDFADGFLLTRASLLWFRQQYLPANVEPSDPRVSPFHGPVISGLKDALVITAGYDPLRVEGRAFAEKLRAEHVRVQYDCYESMIHGFVTMGGQMPAAEEAVWQVALWMKEQTDGIGPHRCGFPRSFLVLTETRVFPAMMSFSTFLMSTFVRSLTRLVPMSGMM